MKRETGGTEEATENSRKRNTSTKRKVRKRDIPH